MKIRDKIILAFVCFSVIPLVLAGIAGFYSINKISSIAIGVTSDSLRQQSEVSVDQQVKKISSSVSMYANKVKKKGDYKPLQYNPEFINLIIQVIGSSGYTFLVSLEEGQNKVFMHPNPRFLSKDVSALGIKGLNKIVSKVVKTKKDYKGTVGKQYLFVHEVHHNLPFYMVAVVPNSDIDQPIKKLKSEIDKTKKQFMVQNWTFGLVLTALALVFAMVFGIRFVRPISLLTGVAEKISMGDLKTSIDIDSQDEVGELANALRRMQASLLKAVQRLQRRK
ncbi:MAG: HAMP domain-containing protein [Desulfobacteraceae bacterium]|nr:MAG: HAMP domain-containing protein [Desulfobacteraceae bacterium]